MCFVVHRGIRYKKIWKQVTLIVIFPQLNYEYIITLFSKSNLFHKDVVFCKLISDQKLQQWMMSVQEIEILIAPLVSRATQIYKPAGQF